MARQNFYRRKITKKELDFAHALFMPDSEQKERTKPMAKQDTQKGRITDALSLNQFEGENNALAVAWRDMLDVEFTLHDFSADIQYDANGEPMKYVCLLFSREDAPDIRETTLVWSGVLHDKLMRLDREMLPLAGAITRKTSAGKREYVDFA